VEQLARHLYRTAVPFKEDGPSRADVQDDVETFVETMAGNGLLTHIS
jgi:hypothetical protein